MTDMKAVILDLDGVYFMNGKENFIKSIHERFKVPIPEIKEVFLKSEMMKKYKQGMISADDFWKYAIAEWHIKSNKDELLDILQQGYELNGKKKEIWKILDDHGAKKIVCSNNFPERIRMLDDRFDFLSEFDFVILSYEYKKLKPQLLDEVSKVTGIHNDEIIYFDDYKENIDHASSIGMHAIHIKEPSRVLKELKGVFDA